ncbi:MAG: MFS transporter [Aquificaceae bacterium]|nr:MFS transporter [Aquificaceae bacterium]
MAKSKAYRFIFLMGLVSLLADFTYEGAKGVMGPYLAYLGAGALAVSWISGLSELAGYWVRLLSGFLSDRLKSYWFFTLTGYAINLFSVPLLGFVKSWQFAGFLIFLERSGKGLRTPSRDVLLSRATAVVGHGKGFGFHEFLDQIGAVLGPLTVGLILLLGYGYKTAFLFLLIPALTALLLLLIAKRNYGEDLEKAERSETSSSLSKAFYTYLLGSCLISLSSLQFPLIGFHLSEHVRFDGWTVAFLFAFAMGVDALSALAFGFLHDKIGFRSLFWGLLPGALVSPLLFYVSQPILAVLFWGVSLGFQESVLRSGVAMLSSEVSRGKAYGLFHFFFGFCAFLGGVFMGFLYEASKEALILYTVALHLLAIGILIKLKP